MTYHCRQFPLPPIEQMRHGAVWNVVLEPARSRSPRKTWDEVLKGDPKPYPCLIVITEPLKSWPKHRLFWWRSRLLVGDLTKRAQEAILADFRRLLIQTPPVRRNWHRNLLTGSLSDTTWHIVWLSEVAYVGG